MWVGGVWVGGWLCGGMQKGRLPRETALVDAQTRVSSATPIDESAMP